MPIDPKIYINNDSQQELTMATANVNKDIFNKGQMSLTLPAKINLNS